MYLGTSLDTESGVEKIASGYNAYLRILMYITTVIRLQYFDQALNSIQHIARNNKRAFKQMYEP